MILRKKAIRYLRFSDLKQSQHSIERQDLYTKNYAEFNDLEIIDTFIDRGRSAKTFDRPDFIKLKQFIDKHYRFVDYLLVDQLDRFSRNAGEAINMVKRLQKHYNIQIVSVTEGIVFDYNTPGSFFRAGLQLLLAEEDNINRSIKVRGTIYAARKEGRYAHGKPPYGYKKEGEGKNKKLAIVEDQARIVTYIFESYIKGVPLYVIRKEVVNMGFTVKGNSAIEKILANPIYAGMIDVKPFKDYPGGLVDGQHEGIINKLTWNMVQELIKKPEKIHVQLSDDFPLKGVLKCHCGRPLTGAPSRGKTGVYYNYYKCSVSRHLNLSANKAHEQMLEIQRLMSIPNNLVKKISRASAEIFERKMREDKKALMAKRVELEKEETKLYNVEEKFIDGDISKETYQRMWNASNKNIMTLKAEIDLLKQDGGAINDLFAKNLSKLTDLRYVYNHCSTLDKRELINIGSSTKVVEGIKNNEIFVS